ncbi:hypothetical protein GUJ93_ZPchr0004g39901 [Zizania palustris]|uniref:Uncharacterized protein n=1 Tax=Zizania palustris TaxID=103762 RepID=A0A8J5T176_ZIZPA|nr:hypothetical protein GUJ93_ZPchr0004g39901 [Zizania palustris]
MAAVVEQAHELYRGGRHLDALELYSAALAAARGPAQRVALHSNRAACYLKLHDFRKAAEECTSVLELDRGHAGALMLRAQTLVTLKDYQSALFDVNRLIEINPSSEVYQNLHARLKTQLALTPIPESEDESLYLEEDRDLPPKGNKKIDISIAKPDQPAAELVVENKPATELILEKKPANELILEKKLATELILEKKPVTEPPKVEVPPSLPSKPQSWQTIPKPKGHSGLDYSKWDKVEDDSSEEEGDDEEELPQYKFKVRTIGVRSVK